MKRGAGHEEDPADGMYPAGENIYVLATGEEKFYLIRVSPQSVIYVLTIKRCCDIIYFFISLTCGIVIFYTKDIRYIMEETGMFSVGSKIVHPMHGAGTIQKIEEKKILGEVKQYYILQLPCDDMSVMIPVESEQSVGIREIVDESVARQAIEVLKQESTSMDRNWNRRYRENMEKLKTGDILMVAEVVRNLMRVSRHKSLSAGEAKMLAGARQILISEIILSCRVSGEEAEKLVEDAV